MRPERFGGEDALNITCAPQVTANNHATFPIQLYVNYSTNLRLLLRHPVPCWARILNIRSFSFLTWFCLIHFFFKSKLTFYNIPCVPPRDVGIFIPRHYACHEYLDQSNLVIRTNRLTSINKRIYNNIHKA